MNFFFELAHTQVCVVATFLPFRARVYHYSAPRHARARVPPPPKKKKNLRSPFPTPTPTQHPPSNPLPTKQFSKLLHKRASSADKEIRIYEGFWHALLSEKEWADTVYTDIIDWVSKRAAAESVTETTTGSVGETVEKVDVSNNTAAADAAAAAPVSEMKAEEIVAPAAVEVAA